jgi:predicted ATPase
MLCPEFLGVLAEGLTGLGRFAEASDAVDKALSRSELGGELWYVPELHRIKGELLQVAGAADSAERCFGSALRVAQQQGALRWELRAALSIARLRMTQSRQEDARAILAPVVDRFTEGFGAADLRAARDMLGKLQR